jgi:hypothetical protein
LTKTPMAHLRKKERWLDHAHAMIEGMSLAKELCRNLGDGVNQAADISWLATSIPSRNVTPRTILGN